MSLATRCPACGTVFRVVSDQLKVSEGWVRCGRCAEVFNAAQQLFELEQAAAAPAPAQRPAAAVHHLPAREPTAAPTALALAAAEEAEPAPSAPSADVASAPATAVAEPDVSAQETSAETLAQPHAEARDQPDGAVAQDQTAGADPPEPVVEAAVDAPAEAAGPAPTPEFIRRAERAARWRHPARRGTLAAVALLLLALLGGQVALHYRDRVAVAWPDTLPWLQAGCSLLGCRIEAPRRIDSLNVDSSGLVRMPDSPLYRLSLVVQNKAATAVRMPAIDLALTDSQGQTMARRVLSAAELGHPADSLPAGGEITLQATLDLGERQLAGYTIELFYP